MITMKIRIELSDNELSSFKEMIRVALHCAEKGGLKMEKSVDDQMEEVSHAFSYGEFTKEFDSFLVVNCFDGVAAVLHRVGAWMVQTLEMVKDLGQIDQEYDKRMKAYLSKKSEKEAE